MEMGYIKKIKIDKDTKKVVSVRVPEIVVNAFNSAGVEAKEFGYELKMPDVIEEALINALNELKDETGVDFLKLEKFKHEMNGLQDKLKIDSKKQLDFNKLSDEIKVQVFNIGNLGQSIDIDLIIKEKKQVIKDSWNEYMISKKQKKVETELSKLEKDNRRLNNQIYDNYQDSELYARDEAIAEGWGDIYDEGDRRRDDYLEKNKDQIQKQIEKQRSKQGLMFFSYSFFEKKIKKMHPEKTDDEIKKIMKGLKKYESLLNNMLKDTISLKKEHPEKTDNEIQEMKDEIKKQFAIDTRNKNDKDLQNLYDSVGGDMFISAVEREV
jgi:hypothetical protein